MGSKTISSNASSWKLLNKVDHFLSNILQNVLKYKIARKQYSVTLYEKYWLLVVNKPET